MDKTIRAFGTHAEADRADRSYYASLTPAERLDILLELVANHQESLGEPAKGFERVYRVIELSRS
jgi:hypothetical protein